MGMQLLAAEDSKGDEEEQVLLAERTDGDEVELPRRSCGKLPVVLGLFALAAAVMIVVWFVRSPQQQTFQPGAVVAEFSPNSQIKVGPPDGGDVEPDTSSSLKHVPPCSHKLVENICHELTGDEGRDSIAVMEFAEVMGVDKDAADKFLVILGSVGVAGSHAHSIVPCQTLCERIYAAMPSSRRPPGHDVGGRRVDGTVFWDIDLSPEALAEIRIPDTPPDIDTNQSVAAPTPAPTWTVRKLKDDLESVIEPDLLDLANNVFRLYPLPPLAHHLPQPAITMAPRRLKTSQNNSEAIFGDGADYKGEQRRTRNGKTCVSWKANDWSGPSNYCRNPDDAETIWCFIDTQRHWAFCDPVGSPKRFAESVEYARVVGKAWLAKTLREFSGWSLPSAYKQWMGPSEKRRAKRVTKKGCPCKKEWKKKGGGTVSNYCGNPDGDTAGEWCFVTDELGRKCEGDDWGHCFPKLGGKPCGPACQRLRRKLVATTALMDNLIFKYDKSKENTFAYIKTWKRLTRKVHVDKIDSINKNFKSGGQVLDKKTTRSAVYKGRKLVILCPEWYKETCGGNIKKCSKKHVGTAVGTIIHETMHHYPIGFQDYLYYRKVVSQWVKANSANKNAMFAPRNAADPVEYFVADSNGYTNTGR